MHHNAGFIHVYMYQSVYPLYFHHNNKICDYNLILLHDNPPTPPPRFLHSPMITRNIRRSDHVTKNSLIMTEWHRSPTNCNVHVSLQITLNISREFSLQMVNSGLLNRLTNCKNLAFTCPLTPKQAPERQIVFMSFVFCLH